MRSRCIGCLVLRTRWSILGRSLEINFNTRHSQVAFQKITKITEAYISKLCLMLFKDPDPGFSQTCFSVATNIVLANMFIYGITGRAKISYLLSMATIPVSVFLNVRDSEKDFEKWKELRVLRLKGVPDRFLPYKCKFDWTDYEKRLIEREASRSASS